MTAPVPAAAPGLQLAPGAGQTTRTWIVYNKPAIASYTHAGMLMGLGLTGARPPALSTP